MEEQNQYGQTNSNLYPHLRYKNNSWRQNIIYSLFNMKKINFLTLPGNESSPPQPIQVNSRKSVCEMIGSLSSHAGKNEDYTNFDVTKTPISSNAFGCTTTEDFSSFSEKHYKHDNTPTTQEDTPP